MKARRRLSAQQVVEIDAWELYSYDLDTATDNGGTVKLGARAQSSPSPGTGSFAADFDARKGGETVTIPGSEIDATQLTDYWVFWVRGDATISAVPVVGNSIEDVYDWDVIFLPGDNADLSFTTVIDQSAGGGGPSPPDTGGGDQKLE